MKAPTFYEVNGPYLSDAAENLAEARGKLEHAFDDREHGAYLGLERKELEEFLWDILEHVASADHDVRTINMHKRFRGGPDAAVNQPRDRGEPCMFTELFQEQADIREGFKLLDGIVGVVTAVEEERVPCKCGSVTKVAGIGAMVKLAETKFRVLDREAPKCRTGELGELLDRVDQTAERLVQLLRWLKGDDIGHLELVLLQELSDELADQASKVLRHAKTQNVK